MGEEREIRGEFGNGRWLGVMEHRAWRWCRTGSKFHRLYTERCSATPRSILSIRWLHISSTWIVNSNHHSCRPCQQNLPTPQTQNCPSSLQCSTRHSHLPTHARTHEPFPRSFPSPIPSLHPQTGTASSPSTSTPNSASRAKLPFTLAITSLVRSPSHIRLNTSSPCDPFHAASFTALYNASGLGWGVVRLWIMVGIVSRRASSWEG